MRPQGTGFEVELAGDRPAFCVSLEVPGLPGRLSDALFALLPGSPRKIRFLPSSAGLGAAAFERALRVRHLRGTYR